MSTVKSYITINKLVEVEVDPHTTSSKSYQTRVEDINENGIVIATPMENRVLVNLSPETTVILWHNDHSASFAHYCKVKARIYEPLPLTFLDWPYEIKKVQRRNFVRVPASIKFDFSLGDRDQKGKEIYHQGITSDLSGGGIKFNTDVSMKKNDQLKIKLYIPDEEKPLELLGNVAWIVNLESTGKFAVGISFSKINESLRDVIIRYEFIKQRELIKKGLL